MKTTRDMSDRHEGHIAAVLGGRVTRGSGNQWRDQMDGKTSRDSHYYAFAWDGKATLGKSIGVTREMWAKAVEQAGMHHPMLPLRFYDDERLTRVSADLVVLDLDTFAEVLADAEAYRKVQRHDPNLWRLISNDDADREHIAYQGVGGAQ